ncbi:LapB repeat-containing protein [Listeria seeligeri]|uniref:LapB repeat-containing protein n=2 Tax=Listeria seeligeri TaxID=1640 RepID=UPI0022EAB947|nr:LapB repeat-containing protein [Listeria seeligeri]
MKTPKVFLISTLCLTLILNPMVNMAATNGGDTPLQQETAATSDREVIEEKTTDTESEKAVEEKGNSVVKSEENSLKGDTPLQQETAATSDREVIEEKTTDTESEKAVEEKGNSVVKSEENSLKTGQTQSFNDWFPDDNLASAVASRFNKQATDTISDDELATLTVLECFNYNITDATGIEYLTGLTHLDLGSNKLTEIDVSKNTKLYRLAVAVTQLTKLDITALPELVSLDCSYSGIAELDISQNLKLLDINCAGNNITKLTDTENLRAIDCSYNKLQDFSNMGQVDLIMAIGQTIEMPKQILVDNKLIVAVSPDLLDQFGTPMAIQAGTGGIYDQATNTITWDNPSKQDTEVTYTFSSTDGSIAGTVTIPYEAAQIPKITADKEHTYLVGDKVTSSQFMQDVHAELTGGVPGQTISNDFDKVNLNKAGDYVVTLSCEGYPPSSESAVPVTVIVHVKEPLEFQVPSSFRMDNNADPNPVSISEKKQTLRCYGSEGNADLEVIDRRSIKQGWTIVGAMTPFTNSKGDILESPLKYQSQTIASSPVFLNTTNQPIEREEASTRTGTVSTTFDLQNQLSMEILPNDALVDDGYEASVTWTLEDVPRP